MNYLTILTAFLFLWIQPGMAQRNEAVSQNPNVRMGQKALLDGDFKSAANYLAKALPAEAADPNVLYMLGYAQYHSGEYEEALQSFTKVVKLRPEDERSYYYRGRLNNILAVQTGGKKLSNAKREALLDQAIQDYTKGIELNGEDAKLFQNRGVAYRDLGILKGTSGTDNYDRKAAADSYNRSIADFEHVLQFFPGRKDIETEIKKARVYRDNLK